MADSSSLQVAVLSDIHAFHGPAEGEPPSHADESAPEDQPRQHPFAGLRSLIKQERLKASVLLCCGDLADKADPGAMKYAWAFLKEVADAMGAQLCATAGNHDVDSRYAHNDFDARGMLQNLVPTFPVEDSTLADRYWARHFCVVESGPLRLVLLNSAAYHGQGPGDIQPPEYSRGRIAGSTLERLKDALQGPSTASVNILACHHHPMAIPDVDPDASQMLNGEALIDLLTNDRRPWLIVHGHKHIPRLVHAQGGNNAPLLFGAGSLSAVLTGRWVTSVRNQFYVLEFPFTSYGSLGLPFAGRFRAWDWHVGLGWQPALDQASLPSAGGFGCRDHSVTVASKVAAMVQEQSGVALHWTEVLDRYPQFEFLSPSDLQRVRRDLQEDFKIRVQWGSGYPIELST